MRQAKTKNEFFCAPQTMASKYPILDNKVPWPFSFFESVLGHYFKMGSGVFHSAYDLSSL